MRLSEGRRIVFNFTTTTSKSEIVCDHVSHVTSVSSGREKLTPSIRSEYGIHLNNVLLFIVMFLKRGFKNRFDLLSLLNNCTYISHLTRVINKRIDEDRRHFSKVRDKEEDCLD